MDNCRSFSTDKLFGDVEIFPQQKKKERSEFAPISSSSKILHGNAEKTVYRTRKIVQTTETH